MVRNAEVTRSGVAQSLQLGQNAVLTKYSNQVTGSTLYTFMHKAINLLLHYLKNLHSWHQQMELKYPTFKCWSINLSIELKLIFFPKFVRSENFSLYKNALKQLLPWFFALDHYHYARWLSIH